VALASVALADLFGSSKGIPETLEDVRRCPSFFPLPVLCLSLNLQVRERVKHAREEMREAEALLENGVEGAPEERPVHSLFALACMCT
jgi:hypothetical protein